MSDQPMNGELVITTRRYSLREVCVICGIEADLLLELTTHGVIASAGDAAGTWIYSERDLLRSKKALRLRHDLGLDWAGLALALDLLDEIERLRNDLARQRREETATALDSPFTP